MKKVLFGSSIGVTLIVFIIFIPILMILDFFGMNITDDYVVNNMDYAENYKETINKAIKNGYGYVPLNRILFFYLEDESLSFYDIYVDNIDKETNKMKTISDVCKMSKYRIFDVCKNYEKSDQLDVEQNKPFSFPVDFSKATITSFFMEERIVFGKSDVHYAWDFASGNKTPVRAVCDGRIIKVSFPYLENVTNISAGGGNQIFLECPVDEDITYIVLYAHLYPGTAKVSQNQIVKVGDELAGVGTTGYSTGPHLHFQVELDGKVVDGMSLIDFSFTDIGLNSDHIFRYNEQLSSQFRP